MRELLSIFQNTDFVHRSGTAEELQVAEFLKSECEKMGVDARIESFPVSMANVTDEHLYADGVEVECKAMIGCGSGEVEGELYHMFDNTPISIAKAKNKIVLMEGGVLRHFDYQDLMKAGALGIIAQNGDLHYEDSDVDRRNLREVVVGDARKVLCAMVHAKTAVDLVKKGVKRVKLVVEQEDYMADSHNVIAEIPGETDEWIVLTAHYDSSFLSHGAYDNMSGCAGLLGIMDLLKDKKNRFGLRFVFCGSEERGLLGSKAYVKDHKDELDKVAFNINLDMIGSYMGKFLAVCSAEERLANYIAYMGAELGFSVNASVGVYSSDSTPFADNGVPALSFARFAGSNHAPIHCKFDLMDVMSMEQLEEDIQFIATFTDRMANAIVCPIKREIPESVKDELDKYQFRKRREA